jgi:Ca2+-binding RTX toxin-like protein
MRKLFKRSYKMSKKNFSRLALILFVLLVFITAISAYASTNIVPRTYLMDQSSPIAASELAPAECGSIRSALTTVVQCTGGNCNGTQGNDLILGSPNADNIKGKNGDDCILGGDGDDDTISGDNGNDVCIGGAGNDVFKKCETEIQ